MMIKVVSLDIGGTIIETNSISNYTLKKLTSIVNKPYEEVRKIYKNIFQKQKGTLEELVNSFCEELNIDINNNISSFFKEKFSLENNKFTMNNKIEKIVQKLKEKGLKIILSSNSCCLIENNFSTYFLENIYDVFYSYNLGYTKEDKEFYSIIETKLNYKPEHFLHIGDTLENDYLFPKKYGWNAIYYGENFNQEIDSITNLEEIINIVVERNNKEN